MYSLTSFPQDLILLDLMLISTPSTAKCGPGFSAMNHLKCNLRTILGQNTLSDLMQMRSSDHAIKAYRPHSAISNWFSGAHKKIFKLTTGIPKLLANFLMMFIPRTSFMLAVQTVGNELSPIAHCSTVLYLIHLANYLKP